RAETVEQLGALAGQFGQQEAPAAAGDVDVLAPDAIQDRRLRPSDVELRADLFERLLGDPVDLDHDRTVVDLEPVDVPGGRAPTEMLEAFHHQRAVPEVGQPGGGE